MASCFVCVTSLCLSAWMHKIQSREVIKKLLGPLQRHGFIPKKNGIVDCACLMRTFLKIRIQLLYCQTSQSHKRGSLVSSVRLACACQRVKFCWKPFHFSHYSESLGLLFSVFIKGLQLRWGCVLTLHNCISSLKKKIMLCFEKHRVHFWLLKDYLKTTFHSAELWVYFNALKGPFTYIQPLWSHWNLLGVIWYPCEQKLDLPGCLLLCKNRIYAILIGKKEKTRNHNRMKSAVGQAWKMKVYELFSKG